MDSILRTAGVRGLVLVGTLALVAALTVLGAVAPDTPAKGPVPMFASAKASSKDGCANGLILQKATAGGVPECKVPGGPESPAEMLQAEKERAAIYSAGSGVVGSGAYAAAIDARNALPNVAGSSSGWALQGKAPLDAGTPYNIISPIGQTFKDLGHRDLTGRITDLARDPATPGRIFASAAEGGVWESRDNGNTWYSIGDHLITQGVGAIAWVPLAPGGSDTGTLIVGTGDNAQGRYNYSGHGIFITHDDGHTWLAASKQVPDPSQNFRIRVSPNDPHRVYVANSKGLYRGVFKADLSNIDFTNLSLPTTPTGYPVNCAGDTTTFPTCFLASNVTDVVVKAQDKRQLVAGNANISVGTTDEVLANVGGRFSSAFYLNANGTAATTLKQVPQAGLYHSSTGFPGSFSFIDDTPSCVIVLQNCYPGSDHVGRVSLDSAIGPTQNTSIVYALVHDPVKERACYDDLDVAVNPCVTSVKDPVLGLPTPAGNLSTVLDGMYYSNQFGAKGSWIKVMDWGQLDAIGTNSSIGAPQNEAAVGYGPGIQSSYNNWVLIDPTSADASGAPKRLLFGLEEIWEVNPNFVCEGNPLTTNWLAVTKFCEVQGANVPWIVIGRYWNACGPFTFGQGILCNGAELGPISGTTTHPDQHAAMFIPEAGGGVTFFAGSDGGMYKQVSNAAHPNFDNSTWGNGISHNMNVLQPYGAEISKDGTIVAGLQDNGEMKIDPKTGKMETIYGGDGTQSGIDPDNSKNILECYVYAICDVTNDGGYHWNRVDAAITQPRFNAPIQMDPKDPTHYLTGGREVKERLYGYEQTSRCIPSFAFDPTCQVFTNASDWYTVYNLGTSKQPGVRSATSSPGDGNNSSSAVDVSGANMYVGFCAQCDSFLEGIPFTNGIATNVGSAAPVKGYTEGGTNPDPAPGWHIAKMDCSNCKNENGTPMNRLPQRYITAIRMDPKDVNTIYVTLGGYHRVWIEPGTLGENNPYIGQGHVFKSTDHGEHFTDISGNFPNTPALSSVIHNGQLVVASDIGVFQSSNVDGGSYSVLGFLPAAPVDTLRISPGNPDLMVAALWGRGVWAYCFSGTTCPSDITPKITPTGPMPNTSAGQAIATWLLAPGLLALMLAGMVARRRRRALLSLG